MNVDVLAEDLNVNEYKDKKKYTMVYIDKLKKNKRKLLNEAKKQQDIRLWTFRGSFNPLLGQNSEIYVKL